MEVLTENNFPFKPNERDCSAYFLNISGDYSKAIKYAQKTLDNLGFLTVKSVGSIGETKKITVITNLLARNILNGDEMACLFSFPRRVQTSTKKVIARTKKMKQYWKQIGLFLCFSRGEGTFPVIIKRINSEQIDAVTIYSLNLNNGEIKELWRNQTDAQEEDLES